MFCSDNIIYSRECIIVYTGQRRIEPTANMMAVYQMNPNAQWFVKCDHRNGMTLVWHLKKVFGSKRDSTSVLECITKNTIFLKWLFYFVLLKKIEILYCRFYIT